MRWPCCFETRVPQITSLAWPPRSDGAGATDASHTSRPTGYSVPLRSCARLPGTPFAASAPPERTSAPFSRFHLEQGGCTRRSDRLRRRAVLLFPRGVPRVVVSVRSDVRRSLDRLGEHQPPRRRVVVQQLGVAAPLDDRLKQ